MEGKTLLLLGGAAAAAYYLYTQSQAAPASASATASDPVPAALNPAATTPASTSALLAQAAAANPQGGTTDQIRRAAPIYVADAVQEKGMAQPLLQMSGLGFRARSPYFRPAGGWVS